MGKPEDRTPLERPRGIWEDNIKVDLKIRRMAGLGFNSSGSGLDMWRAAVNKVMTFWVPQNVESFLTSQTVGFP